MIKQIPSVYEKQENRQDEQMELWPFSNSVHSIKPPHLKPILKNSRNKRKICVKSDEIQLQKRERERILKKLRNDIYI